MRVLVADDEVAIRRLLERSLRGWGYEVETAADGLAAWKALKNEPAPGVVIMDWDMPGMSGLEVTRLLRSTAHSAGVYVLMLTGRQEKADLIEALEAGVDDFLSKPFHQRELQLRLARGAREVSAGRAAAGAAAEAPPTGTTLAGRFRLERKIAEGGMSSVWLAVHLSLGINVAIKFMNHELTEKPDYTSFEREARAAAQLRSAHVVRLFDHGITSGGLPFLVMEYLSGESLGVRVERDGPLPLDDLLIVIEQAALALNEVHARALVHRDIKPDNIVLADDPDREGEFVVKLVDFGLVKRSVAGGPTEFTAVAGTPNYMNPEYIRGEVGLSPMLDLWGLALSAFAGMTGQAAFPGSSAREAFRRICMDELPVPSRVNDELTPAIDAWFARACARDPAARFQTATELAAALRAAAESGTTSSQPTSRGLRRSVDSLAPTQADIAPPSDALPPDSRAQPPRVR